MIKKTIILIATFVIIDALVICLTRMIKKEQDTQGITNNNTIVVDESDTP